MASRCFSRLALGVVSALALASVCRAQTGTIRGTVSFESTSEPMHAVRVVLSPAGRSTDSGEDGSYQFENVPPGTYELVAQSPGLTGDRPLIRLAAGATETVDLRLRIASLQEAVTVTATGREEALLNSLQSVAVLNQTELVSRSAASLGEVLDNEPGIAKRSSGPGNSRPVIRGFDGDRVLVLEDGIRTGSLSAQSGDHGEPVDVNRLERLEIVRGPATLLYGPNAVGGVVNAVSRHETHQHADPGVRGFLTAVGGSNNALGGGSGGFEFGAKDWMFWASGGGQRTGDYQAPIGEIRNSQTRVTQTEAGLGHYGEKSFFSFNYRFTDSRYGVPFDPEEEDPEIPELLLRRHSYRGTAGVRNVGFLDAVTARLNYSSYHHQELIGGEPETNFFNDQFVYRVVADQKKTGLLSGSFGIWGMHRDYKTIGEEALAPPTTQDGFAAFALENLDFESKTRLQFGARIERNSYDPMGLSSRSFTGFSGAIGASQRLWADGALAVNYSHSYRAPSLEELYNNGPHPGNQTFEIGNSNLKSERNNGIDISLRHLASRFRGELNFFYYGIHNFVYLAPTGEIEDGLPAADYAQADSRFRGFEAKVDVGIHPNFWLNLGADAVNARLKEGDVPLPRIPPVRGKIGFEARYRGFTLQPEVIVANSQTGVFTNETPTAGYAVVNLKGAYTLARAHQLHQFTVDVFNAGDTLYRNHLSFIKAFAPEIGVGVRFGYTVQMF